MYVNICYILLYFHYVVIIPSKFLQMLSQSKYTFSQTSKYVFKAVKYFENRFIVPLCVMSSFNVNMNFWIHLAGR